jgi:hypothetical protein
MVRMAEGRGRSDRRVKTSSAVRSRARSARNSIAVVLLVGVATATGCAADADPSESSAPSLPGIVRVDGVPVLEPGTQATFEIYAHCGVKLLGQINGRYWVSPEPGDGGNVGSDWFPEEWRSQPNLQSIPAVIALSDDGSTITATYRDRAVIYEPIDEVPLELSACD